ncbi:MAG: MFS transporter [Planctomycetota bacterium]
MQTPPPADMRETADAGVGPSWWGRAVESRFGYSVASAPLMARSAFRKELLATTFMPFLLVAFDGTVVAVLIRIAFENRPGVSDGLLNSMTALAAVSAPLANITSFIWTRISHGMPKVRFVTTLQLVIVALVVSIALVPFNSFGLAWTITAVLLSRACWSGIMTIRSTIWKANYPDGARARLTGKFATVQVVSMALLSIGLAVAMEQAEWAFRVLLPIGCVMGLVGRQLWCSMPVRHERQLLRDELQAGDKGPSFNPVAMVRILAGDRSFAVFMLFQFLLGLGNITSMGLVAVVLRERFGVEYLEGMLINTAVPLVLMASTVPLWAKFVDRVHIVEFRAVHSWVFVVALLAMSWGLHTDQLWLVFAFAAIKGIAFGGGALAWTLGHLDFAPPGQVSNYMGVHVTLTGVRGVLAWVVGIAMYERAEAFMPGAGSVVFTICALITMAGALGFVWMAKQRQRDRQADRSEPHPVDEVSGPARVGT